MSDPLGLSRFPLLKPLSENDRERLTAAAQELSFLPGENIEPPRGCILVILEGTVECILYDAAEGQHLLSEQGPGSVFGELAVLVEKRPHDGKVIVRTKDMLQAAAFPEKLFCEIIFSNPDSAKALAQMLAKRLDHMNLFANHVVDPTLDPTESPARTFGEKFADLLAKKFGSWKFIVLGLAATALWILLNSVAAALAWDPYPFIFFNLILSLASALTMPVVLMSQNRQSDLDRMRFRAMAKQIAHLTQALDRLEKGVRSEWR